MALPRVKFLSNPRQMHSKGEGEEKEEQGLPTLLELANVKLNCKYLISSI